MKLATIGISRWAALKIIASAAQANRITVHLAFPLWFYPRAWPVLLRGWSQVRQAKVEIVYEAKP